VVQSLLHTAYDAEGFMKMSGSGPERRVSCITRKSNGCWNGDPAVVDEVVVPGPRVIRADRMSIDPEISYPGPMYRMLCPKKPEFSVLSLVQSCLTNHSITLEFWRIMRVLLGTPVFDDSPRG
jgi:hypothetical protein